MELSRNYLTSDELSDVINDIIDIDDEYGREIIKVSSVVQILINDVDWNLYANCNEIYDAYMAQNDFDLDVDVKNYCKIDEIINKENSLEKVVERFLDGINEKVDEYSKNVDLESLKGVLGELKKMNNEDESKELVVENKN